MLAVSPQTNGKFNQNEGEIETFTFGTTDDDFLDFDDSNQLNIGDFDDLFLGVNDGDFLPDLEMDPEILAEFSINETTTTTSLSTENLCINDYTKNEEEDKSNTNSNVGEEVVGVQALRKEGTDCDDRKRRKSSISTQLKNSHGKRKVDWTPELHKRFVQAVEQLGVDKAVPSRILELMGIDCLTRHNIASHLQKYRSHRRHLAAREAEAASWSQRRQTYVTAATVSGGKRDTSPWLPLTPTIGFPPITSVHHYRPPLHVWGHPPPAVDHSYMWRKPLSHSPSSLSYPLPTWPPAAPPPLPPPPPDPSYWHHHHHHRVQNVLTPGTLRPRTPMRFHNPAAPVRPASLPSYATYKPDPASTVGFLVKQSPTTFDFSPTEESIDAAIGDVLSKPRLPLPLGLKPPSVDGVMVELQRQGIPNIPPSCA